MQTVPVIVVLTAIDNDGTFSDRLCPQLNDSVTSVRISNYAQTYFELPDCFYLLARPTALLLDSRFILRGNSTHTNPLLRINAERLTDLFMPSARLIHYTADGVDPPGFAFEPDWDSIFVHYPVIGMIVLNDCNLVGSLPAVLPSNLYQLTVASNNLSGSIPSSLLSNASSTSEIVLHLSENKLSGTLPQTLFARPVGDTGTTLALKGLWLDASKNQINGSIPSAILTRARFTAGANLNFNFEQNLLSGQLPINWLMDCCRLVSTFFIKLASNRHTGIMSENFLSASFLNSATGIQLEVWNNSLTGSIPANLILPLQNPANLRYLYIFANNNQLSGTIPPLLGDAAWTNLITLSFRLSFNSLIGFPYDLVRSSHAATATTTIDLRNNLLSGELSSDLLMGATSGTRLTIYLDNNFMTGNPLSIIKLWPLGLSIGEIELRASNNNFSGSIAPLFGSTTPSCTQITIDLSRNQYTSSIPAGFLTNAGTMTQIFTLNLARNRISGTLPEVFLPDIGLANAFNLDMSNNFISGALPSNLMAESNPRTFILDLASNRLSGSIPPYFISNSSIMYSLALDNNPLRSALPSNLVFNSTGTVVLSLRNCSLYGELPSSLIVPSGSLSPSISLESNNISGSLNFSNFIHSLIPAAVELRLSISRNLLNGSIIMPLPGTAVSFDLYLYASSNFLTSLDTTPGVSYLLHALDISNNPSLTGTIPNKVFDSSLSLIAFNTKLSGTLPPMVALFFNTFDMRNSDVDFCSPSSQNNSITTVAVYCSLLGTNAENCASRYPLSCFNALNPAIPPFLQAPPLSPPPIPMSSPVEPTCDLRTRPSAEFICVGTEWTANAGVTAPTLTIPSGSSSTVINGNISSHAITFSDTSSTLVVHGCVTNLSTINIQLTKSQIEKLPSKSTHQLLTYGGSDDGANNTCADIGNVKIELSSSGGSCRRVSVTKSHEFGRLSVLFSVDKSGCNTWWIVLVAVVGGVVVLGVLVVVLLAVFVPSFRKLIRPYSKRSGPVKDLQ